MTADVSHVLVSHQTPSHLLVIQSSEDETTAMCRCKRISITALTFDSFCDSQAYVTRTDPGFYPVKNGQLDSHPQTYLGNIFSR